ncbi:MAG: GspH/FimT family pseudopilin [Pseudomonadota bacterium]
MLLTRHAQLNCKHEKPNSDSLGFTLLELMMTVSMLGILASVAAPSFLTYIEQARVRSTTLELQNSLVMARNYALAHGQTVQLCQHSLTRSDICEPNYRSNRSWKYGWLIFVDTNNDNEFQSDELIRKIALSGESHVLFNQRGRLRFFSNGMARSAGFYLCDEQSRTAKHIKLLHTGRIRTVDLSEPKVLKKCLDS